MPEPQEQAPDFQLQDTEGSLVSLSSFRGIQNVYLVFNRGFACAFCRQHMIQLRRDAKAFSARHTAILVIAPDRTDIVQKYWGRDTYPFPALMDPDHRAADLYGQTVDSYRRGRLPLVVLVGWDGRIRFRHDSSSEADLPPDSAILEIVDRINLEPPAS